MRKTKGPILRAYRSDIPAEAVEEFASVQMLEGDHAFFRTARCLLAGEVVGERRYSADGGLLCETPMKNGLKHGREITWGEDGTLELIEPYFDGRIHGTARQYGRDGKPIGTYKLVHGTGYDIWRQETEDGRVYISEIHGTKDGQPDGYEWWFDSEQTSVWHECHWHEGLHHGIERVWSADGGLRRGFPKYWIREQRVTKRAYVRAASVDSSLPAFREEDNMPDREILRAGLGI
jgi:hypothetical protein